jgi:hypothetical protein
MNKKMLWISIALVAIALIAIPATAGVPPQQGGCWVTAGGTMDYGGYFSSFGGTAMTMNDKTIHGTWNHVSNDYLSPEAEEGIHFTGKVHYIVCKKFPSLPGPGIRKAIPNYVNLGGTGILNGDDGYYFDVKIFDHGEPGINLDRYVIDVYDSNKKLVVHEAGTPNDNCIADIYVTPDLAWVKDMGCITGGNINIMPPSSGHPY